MGNVELQQSSIRRKPIFGHRDHAKTFTQQKTRENPFQTLKMHNLTSEKVYNADDIKTYRNRNKVQKITRERAMPKDNKILKQSSRVNNINEFLIHLRKQINEQSVANSKIEQARQGQPTARDDYGNTHELILNLRLENERLELQKYKGLVERQLEKSHSIESIKVEGHDKEKRMTIKYEELSHRTKVETYPVNSRLSLEDRIVHEQAKYNQKVERAYKLYYEMMQRNQALQQALEDYQHPVQTQRNNKKRVPQNSHDTRYPNVVEEVRVNKIENLFKNIDELQNSQTLIETQIKEALKMQRQFSESELSGSFREEG